MAALWARARTGRGQVVDISHFEVMTSLDQYTVAMWTHSGFSQHRVGNSSPGPWHPIMQARCKDGALSITAAGPRLPLMLKVMRLTCSRIRCSATSQPCCLIARNLMPPLRRGS
jgi:CoA-transferase family III